MPKNKKPKRLKNAYEDEAARLLDKQLKSQNRALELKRLDDHFVTLTKTCEKSGDDLDLAETAEHI